MSAMQAGHGTLHFGRPSSLWPAGERTDARSRRARTQREKRTYATKGGGATPSAAEHPCVPISNRSRTEKAAHEDASFPPLLICAYIHNTNRVISRSTYRVPHFPSRFPQKKKTPTLAFLPCQTGIIRTSLRAILFGAFAQPKRRSKIIRKSLALRCEPFRARRFLAEQVRGPRVKIYDFQLG